MSPVKGPDVIVRFYDNFHQIDNSNVSFVPGGTYEDGGGFIHRIFKVTVQATGGSYRLALLSHFFTFPESPGLTSRETAPIAWNTSAEGIATQLGFISETEPNGDFWVWTGVELSPNVYELDARSALVGGQQKLPEGVDTDNDTLSGHLVWDWDEFEHEVPLTEGGCASPDIPPGEISPEGAQQGNRPSDRPVSGSRGP